MKKLSKIISLTLVLCMLLSVVVFADEHEYLSDSFSYSVPIVNVCGDGVDLVTEDGKTIEGGFYCLGTPFSDDEKGDAKGIFEAAYNIVKPLVTKGVFLNQYDDYYDALRKEISEMYSDFILDANGEKTNGTQINKEARDRMAEAVAEPDTSGSYTNFKYAFSYDWRLDPFVSAAELNTFIKKVKEATGYEKVALKCQCIGSVIVMAYLAEYGTDDICGLGFDGAICYGNDVVTDLLTGKLKIDLNAVSRTLLDMSAIHEIDELDPAVAETLSLVENCGTTQRITKTVRYKILGKIFDGAYSALALSTIYGMPSYWATVSPDKLDDALNYVFGPEGSKKRTEYAGLIEKIMHYQTSVRANLETILKNAEADGVKIAVVSKYGTQLFPVVESVNALSDDQVSVANSSFGATTTKLNKTFSEDYLSTANSDYISPDKHIDSSTCLFPEYTWFIKGAYHSKWINFESLLLSQVITADVQYTTKDTYNLLQGQSKYLKDKDINGQYLIYDLSTSSEEWSYKDGFCFTMTEENMNTESWVKANITAVDDNEKGTLKTAFTSFFKWIKTVLTSIGNFFRDLINKAK